MNFLQTSGDLLNVMKAFAVFVLAIAFGFFLYYLTMLVREAFLATREMRLRVHKIDEVIQAFKEKIEHSASYLLLIGEGVKKLAELAMKYWEKEKKKGSVK